VKKKIACWKCILFYCTSLCWIRTADKVWFLNCFVILNMVAQVIMIIMQRHLRDLVLLAQSRHVNPHTAIILPVVECGFETWPCTLRRKHRFWGYGRMGVQVIRFGRMSWERKCVICGMKEMCLQGFERRQAWRKETIWKDGRWY